MKEQFLWKSYGQGSIGSCNALRHQVTCPLKIEVHVFHHISDFGEFELDAQVGLVGTVAVPKASSRATMRSMTWIDVFAGSVDSIFIMWLVQCSMNCSFIPHCKIDWQSPRRWLNHGAASA